MAKMIRKRPKNQARYSRKTETGSLKDPVLDLFKRKATWTTKPTARHGSFPTDWSTKVRLLKKDPLGQQG